MAFLAQIDFSALPPITGFPRAGVAQVFLPGDDDLMGMDLDNPEASGIAVLARANGAGAVRHENSAAADPLEDCSPFIGARARQHGVPLVPAPFTMAIDAGQWQAEARLDGQRRREGVAAWEDALEVGQIPAHHVGGYPVFVQGDFREAGRFGDYDCCLLHLTYDKHLQWGDVGEANLLIRPADLARGDFSKVIFWWDCS